MNEPPQEDAPAREPRLGRFIGIMIERAGKPPERAIASNVSASGLGGKTSLALMAGERVTLHLPNDERLSATVRWCAKGRFGVSLDQQIDPSAVKLSEDNKPSGHVSTPQPQPQFELFRHVSSTHRPGLKVR